MKTTHWKMIETGRDKTVTVERNNTMRFKRIPFSLAAALAIGLASCSKNEPATPAADDANKAAETAKIEAAKTADAARAAEPAKAEAAKAEAAKAEAAKAEAAKAEAAKAEAAKAEAAKDADNGKVQGLIDKAKSLIAESKFSDASSVLQQLTGQSLSAEQTKLVDGLKEQIQKALAASATDNAAGAVGNLLKR